MDRNLIRHYEGYIRAKFLMFPLGGQHVTCSAMWNLVPTQHLLWGQGIPRKTLIELAGRRTFRMQIDF
jgi:hypothetical protein